MLDIILYFIIGFTASLLGSMAGLGGGFLAIPLLLYLGVEPRLVVGSAKFMVLINSIVSTSRYLGKLKFPYKLYISIAVPMIITAYIGAYFAAITPKEVLLLILGSILMVGSIRLILGNEAYVTTTRITRDKYYIGILSGAFAGFVAGVTGLGGGVVNMPIFINILKLDPHTAVSLSMACILPSAFSSVIRHFIDHIIEWQIAVPLGIGAVIGGFTGPRLAISISKAKLKKIIGVLILLATIRILYVALSSLLA